MMNEVAASGDAGVGLLGSPVDFQLWVWGGAQDGTFLGEAKGLV